MSCISSFCSPSGVVTSGGVVSVCPSGVVPLFTSSTVAFPDCRLPPSGVASMRMLASLAIVLVLVFLIRS